MIRPRRDRQRGITLIMVLWVSLFLSVLLAGAFATVRIEAKIVRADIEQFQAEQAARGALITVMHQLNKKTRSQNTSPVPATLNVGDFDVKVSYAPEMRKADINLASEEALAAVFAQAGAEPENAVSIASRIADWRDEDDLVRSGGAEKRDYAKARNGASIGNRPFLSTSELFLVLDLEHDLVKCAIDSLTVFGTAYAATRNIRADRQPSSISVKPGSRVTMIASISSSEPNAVPAEYSSVFLMTGRRNQPFEVILKNIPARAGATCA